MRNRPRRYGQTNHPTQVKTEIDGVLDPGVGVPGLGRKQRKRQLDNPGGDQPDRCDERGQPHATRQGKLGRMPAHDGESGKKDACAWNRRGERVPEGPFGNKTQRKHHSRSEQQGGPADPRRSCRAQPGDGDHEGNAGPLENVRQRDEQTELPTVVRIGRGDETGDRFMHADGQHSEAEGSERGVRGTSVLVRNMQAHGPQAFGKRLHEKGHDRTHQQYIPCGNPAEVMDDGEQSLPDEFRSHRANGHPGRKEDDAVGAQIGPVKLRHFCRLIQALGLAPRCGSSGFMRWQVHRRPVPHDVWVVPVSWQYGSCRGSLIPGLAVPGSLMPDPVPGKATANQALQSMPACRSVRDVTG